MPLSVGDKLGPYEILAPIGAGGMGEVYKARDPRLDRTVAIKTSKREFSERFEREARAIAALNHPHICQIFDVGPNYLVMEFVEGTPLSGPLPLDKALEYAGQIAGTLDAAHSQHIIHRDLKPANILVTKSGVKLLDFGLAKINKPLEASEETVTMGLTMKGQILGTLFYMSPEQINGQEADARSDIFSFGLVLYEILTGKRAFEGATPASVLAAILERPAPSIADVAPAGLNRVLKRCLEKAPENRWQSARDLRAALELVTEDRAAVPAKAPRPPKRYTASAVAAVAVVAAIGVSAIHFREQPPAADVTRFQVLPPQGQTFSGRFSLSPNGKYLAFEAADSAGVVRIFLRPLNSVDAKAVVENVTIAGPAGLPWSPDSRFLEIPDVKNPRKVAVADGSSESLTGGRGRAIALPDGVHEVVWENNAIILRSPTEGAPVKVLKPNVGQTNLDYAPIAGAGGNGYLLYMQDSALMAQRLDLKKLELTSDPVTVVNGVARGGAGTGYFSVSGNGALAFRPGSRARVSLLLDRQGKQLGTFPGNSSVALSPDGTKAVVTEPVRVADGAQHLQLVDLVRQASEQFTFGAMRNVSPVWSPDGTRVAFSRGRAEGASGQAIYVKPANGAQAEELLYEWSGGVYPNSWSHDGRSLLFSRFDPKTKWDLWVLNLADKKATPFLQSEFEEIRAEISTDGRWVAYDSNESGRLEVYVRSFPDGSGKWLVSRDGGREARWRRDGKELFYRDASEGLVSVEILPGATFQFGRKQALLEWVGAGPGVSQSAYYDVTPGGQRFLVLAFAPETTTGPITVVLNWMETLKK